MSVFAIHPTRDSRCTLVQSRLVPGRRKQPPLVINLLVSPPGLETAAEGRRNGTVGVLIPSSAVNSTALDTSNAPGAGLEMQQTDRLY